MEKDKFLSNWNDFITVLRGKLISTSRKQQLTYPLAKLILTDAALAWSSEYEVAGRWLNAYCAANPEKGQLVKQVLTTDMVFTEEQPQGELPAALTYVVPATGAVAGFAISRFCFTTSIWVQAAATLLPAALLYPAAKQMVEGRREQGKDRLINAYIDQLTKYRQSVESILME